MQRWLRITKESAFGVASTDPADSIAPCLAGANSFRHMTTPQYWRLVCGTGFAVPSHSGTETTAVGASLTVPLAYGHAAFLLGWACGRINAAKTSPWATSEPAGDLPSCRIEYAWTTFDGTLKTKAWTGCKVASWTLAGNADAKAPMSIALQVVGSKPIGNTYDPLPDPTVAVPDPDEKASDWLLFQHLRDGLTVGAGKRTNWKSIEIASQNRLKPYFDESRFANAIRLGGRTTTIKANLRLKPSPDDRATWETGGALAMSAEFKDSATKIHFDFGPRNFLDSVSEDYPEDAEVYYDLSATNHVDPATGTDFSCAVSAV